MVGMEDAARLIDQDDRSSDDIVFAGGRNKRGRPHYHEKECYHINPDFRRMTRQKAKQKLLVPCAVCVLESIDETEPDSTGGLPTELIEHVREQMKARDSL